MPSPPRHPAFAPAPARPQLTLAQLSHQFAEAAHRPSPIRSPHSSWPWPFPNDQPDRHDQRDQRGPNSAKHTRSKSAVPASSSRDPNPLRKRPSLGWLFNMGQAHGKTSSSEHSSPAATSPSPSSVPIVIDCPAAAPTAAPLASAAPSPVSRGASTASRNPPSAYHQRSMSGGRGLVRKLSSRARLLRESPEDRRAAAAAETSAPASSPASPVTWHQTSFARRHETATAQTATPPSPRTPPPPRPFPGHLAHAALSPRHPLVPRIQASTHHCPSGSSARSSARESIKSARRAEREWRAKIAALGASASAVNLLAPAAASPSPPRGKLTALSPAPRGPVPPLRPSRPPVECAASAATSSSSSASSDQVATPPLPHARPVLLARRMGNRSFETLGHHARAASFVRTPQATLARLKPDPASSVCTTQLRSDYASSFYANPNGSHVSTRPPSLAMSALLGGAEPASREAAKTDAPSSPSAGKVSVLPVSPVSLATFGPTRPSLAGAEPQKAASVAHSGGHRLSLPSTTTTPMSFGDSVRRCCHPTDAPSTAPSAGPSQPRKPAALSLHLAGLPVTPRTAAPPSSTMPRRLPRTPRTPRTPSESSQPATPFSPTTAFILTVPSIERLAWSGTIGASPTSPCARAGAGAGTGPGPGAPGSPASPGPRSPDADYAGRGHPFAFACPGEAAAHADEPEILLSPVPPLSPAAVPARGLSPPAPGPLPPARGLSPPASRLQATQTLHVHPRRSPPPPLAAVGTGSPRAKTHLSTTPARASSKAQVLGSSQAVNRATMRGGGLTPGMDTGKRPPKSGLPMDRWLSQTSIA